MSSLSSHIIIGTRGSALSRWQTGWVQQRLQAAWPGLICEIQYVTTAGDRDPEAPLPEIGGKGLFTGELENALRGDEVDLAVHSLKDLPVEASPGLTLGAICEREDARDVLAARKSEPLMDLPSGARVGTSSLRRKAQLLAARPDLEVLPMRGNVDTRLRKLREGHYEAIALAAAGLLRLKLEDAITEYLPFDVMLPAPGQGAMAAQCRAGDARILELLAPLDDPDSRQTTSAERAFLKALGGGCATPVAAYAHLSPSPDHASRSGSGEGAGGWGRGLLHLTGLVASLDGRQIIRVSGHGPGSDAEALGRRLAEQALAEGAGELLQ